MMRSLLLIIVFVHCVSQVIGGVVADGLPKLTMDGTPISPEELDTLNKLRQDVMESLENLKSGMEEDNSKQVLDKLIEETLKKLTKDSYKIDDGIAEHVSSLKEVNEYLKDEVYVLSVWSNNKFDKQKLDDYLENVLPDFVKRLKPFLKYDPSNVDDDDGDDDDDDDGDDD